MYSNKFQHSIENHRISHKIENGNLMNICHKVLKIKQILMFNCIIIAHQKILSQKLFD